MMMVKAEPVLKQAGKKGGEHLGDIVFPRFRGATVKHSDLLDLAKSNGFPESLLPEGLNADQAFQYACRRTKGLGDHLLRQISKNKDSIVWGLVRENRDQDNKLLDYTQVSRLTLSRNTGDPTYGDPTNPHILRVDEKFNALVGSVTTDDIRRMVVHACKGNGGVPVGTSWFVPAQHADMMRAMKATVEALGESEMWLLPIYDSDESRDSIGRAAREDLQDQINGIKQEMEDFSAEQTRPSTLQRRLNKFNELREKAKLYANIVKVVHSDLLEEITVLEGTVSSMLSLRQHGDTDTDTDTDAGSEPSPDTNPSPNTSPSSSSDSE